MEEDNVENFEDDFDYLDEGENGESNRQAAVAEKTRPNFKKIIAIGVVFTLATFIILNSLSSDDDSNAISAPNNIANNDINIPVATPTDNGSAADFTFDEFQGDTAVPTTTATPEPQVIDNSGVFNSINDLRQELFEGNQVTTSNLKGLTPMQQLQQTLVNLNLLLSKNMSQNSTLEATLSSVSRTLKKVNSNITGMEGRTSQLSELTSSLSNEVNSLKRSISDDDWDITEKVAAQKEHQPLVYTGPEYVVHAIIPGRAWLKSASGQIITVTEGDSMDNYGKVIVIDAGNGAVLTSSGIAFK